MSCCLCGLKYDIDCINISEKRFQLMEKEYKTTWKCQACKNQQPKLDNQNTPLRGTGEPGPNTLERGNVTIRNKSSKPISQEIINTAPATIQDISELIDRKLSPNSTIMNNLRTALREDIKRMITAELNTAINQLKADFTTTTDFLYSEQVDLKTALDRKCKEIDVLHNNKLQLERDITNLNTRLTTLEKISRDKNIEIHGIQENKNENLKQLFGQLCNSINICVPEAYVQTCRRVASLDKTAQRPRNVLITLSSPRVREDVLAAVANYNKTHKEKLNTSHFGIQGTKSNVYISEHLSLECKKLFREARKAGKEKDFKFVWVKRGNIFVKKNESSMPILIKNMDCLKTLV